MSADQKSGILHVVYHPDGWTLQDRAGGVGNCIARQYGSCSADYADRLVSCWNACLGIEDPAELRRKYDEVCAARDELLEALEALKDPSAPDWVYGIASSAIKNASK